MKKISTAILAGILTLGFGTATGWAGDRTLVSQGRSGFTYTADKQETTVAVYTDNRRDQTSMSNDREDGRMLKIQGRQGVNYRVH